jgi:hypothetical protein
MLNVADRENFLTNQTRTKMYLELKQKYQKEFDELPVFFAFNTKQFEEGITKLNTTKDKIYSIGGGGFIRKLDVNLLKDYFTRADFD